MAFGDRIRLASAAGMSARDSLLGYAVRYQEWTDFYRGLPMSDLRRELARFSRDTVPATAHQGPRYAALRRILQERKPKEDR